MLVSTVPKLVANNVKKSVPEELSPVLTKHLTEHLIKAIPIRVNEETPNRVVKAIGHDGMYPLIVAMFVCYCYCW